MHSQKSTSAGNNTKARTTTKTTTKRSQKKATRVTKRKLSTSTRRNKNKLSQSTRLASLLNTSPQFAQSNALITAAFPQLTNTKITLGGDSIVKLPNFTALRKFTTQKAKKSLFPSSIRQEQALAMANLNNAGVNATAVLHAMPKKSLFVRTKRHFSTQNGEEGSTPAAGAVKDLSSNADPSLAIENFDLHPDLVRTLIDDFKISNLFPIQAQVMKPIQAGQDLFGKSKTGTGKTLAFLLPMLDQIAKGGYQRPAPNTAQILILEPTRELALQVGRELEKLNPRIRVGVVYGGSSYEPQRQALRSGCHIVVATPGRLIDLVDSGSAHLGATSKIVLDEADEMLRLGFQQNVEQILQQCDPKRQTILFSATLPSSIQGIVRKYTNNVQFIDCAAGSEATPSLIKHKACMLPRNHSDIPGFVFSLFRMYSSNGRAMVFSDTKAMASELETLLNSEAKSQNFCAALHGDVSQTQRENILQRFREGRISMLLATDVAARGIDIPSVDLVVQLGIPRELESYVHRSGRTGRAGKSGTAVLCYRHNERDQMGSLSSQTGVRFAQVVREDLKTVDIDEATMQTVQRAMGTGYPLFAKRVQDQQESKANENSEEDESSNHDPAFAAAIAITDQLMQQYDPRVLLTRDIYNQLRQKATGGAEGTPFSLLTSTPHHTTIAFPPNESVPSITRRLSTDLTVPTHQIKMLNQTYTNQAVLVDIPDDIFNSMKPLIDGKSIDYIQIPRKLPSELFVGGQIGSGNKPGGGRGGFGGNNRGGDRNGGGFGGNNRGGDNRNGGGFGGNNRGGYGGGDRNNNNSSGGYGGNTGGNRSYGGNSGGSYGGNNGGSYGGNRSYGGNSGGNRY